jgi:hypothetical protein
VSCASSRAPAPPATTSVSISPRTPSIARSAFRLSPLEQRAGAPSGVTSSIAYSPPKKRVAIENASAGPLMSRLARRRRRR